MATADRTALARDVFLAFAAGDREQIESLLASDFRFHSPPDPDLDRAGYFDRCWSHSGNGTSFDFVRVVETGHEVVVTYNATRRDGSRFRNTEVLTFVGEQVAEVEVYFGWNLAPQPS